MLSWDLPYHLGGPVLAWELYRGQQKWTVRILVICFLSFCLLHFLVLSFATFNKINQRFITTGRPAELKKYEVLQMQNEARISFATNYLSYFFPTQLLLLLLATPALAAGALGTEKENDTLIALFVTELADHEIVRGKVLGRYWQLMRFMLYCLVFPLALAGFARIDLLHVALCVLHAMVITFALVGICIFSAIITRRTRDAILACYSIMIIITLISLTLLGDRPLPTWLNPVEVVIGLSTPPFTNIAMPTLLTHLLVFWLIGWVFVLLSCWCLRWACLRQMEDRSMRWRWGIRRNMGDDPIRWRERNIMGIAPLPALRMIPTWLGMLGCMAFSISMILGIVNNMTHGRMVYLFTHGEWNNLVLLFQRLNAGTLQGEVILMGVILIVFSTVTIYTRCAGAITEEKRMKTWDDLLMTGLRIDSIAASKMWGILQASILFIASYTLPLLVFSFFGGIGCVISTIVCVVITAFGVYFAAEIGMGVSMSSAEKPLRRSR